MLAAAIALPLAVALVTYGLADDAEPPTIPVVVRVGESADPSEPASRTTAPSTTANKAKTPTVKQPAREPEPPRPTRKTQVVPPPPVIDGDDEWGDDDGGADDSPDDDDNDDDD